MELTIGGKKYTAKFGLRFLENVTTSEGITIIEVFTKFEKEYFLLVPKLIYYAINTATPESITLDEVYDWIDEIGINSKEIEPFLLSFSDSMKVHAPQEPVKPVGKPRAKKS